MRRIGGRADNDEIVVHNVAAIDAVAVGDEFVLARTVVDQERIGVAVLADHQRLAGADRNDVDAHAGRGLEDRKDIAEQPGVLGRRGRTQRNEPLVGLRGADNGDRDKQGGNSDHEIHRLHWASRPHHAANAPQTGRGHRLQSRDDLLTIVSIPVTSHPSNLARRRALSRCDPESGASAVPAGGFANRSRAAPGPRSTGMTTGLRGARLTRDRPKRVTPATPGLRKRGTGAEPKVDASALASAAAERREASDPRWGRVRARPRSGGNVWACGAG